MNRQLEQNNDEIAMLTQKLKEAEETISRLRDDNDKVTRELFQSQKDLIAVHKEINALMQKNMELKPLVKENEELKKQVKGLSKKLKDAQKTINNYNAYFAEQAEMEREAEEAFNRY